MYEATSTKLTIVGNLMPKGLFWWRTLTKSQVERRGTYDPPCPVLSGKFGPFKIELLADGDVYIGLGDRMVRLDKPINTGKHPYQIADDLRLSIIAFEETFDYEE